MPRPDATRDDVLAAIQEYNELGREGFLAKYRAYGFSWARDYFVREEARFYDSKVLLAAAHGYRHGEPLRASEFSGGDAAAAAVLRRLGFVVTEPNRRWSEDEVVLACDLVARNRWRGLQPSRPEVAELSDLLQRCSPRPTELRGPGFREPVEISRKTAALARCLPPRSDVSSIARRLERQVVDQFLTDPEGMTERATAIRAAMEAAETFADVPDLDLPASSKEGRVLERMQILRERDPKLRQQKIQTVLAAGGVVACEVCGFDFEATYGERGHGYIEVHHRTPLHVTGPTFTQLPDLALLCSNCHQMIHRQQPWLSVEQLRELTSTQIRRA
jgi:5-methylcytosine-specific restriction enzyme A